MAKPPAAGPSSDIEGVNRDARIGTPNRDPAQGTAADKQKAEERSKARPPQKEGESGNTD